MDRVTDAMRARIQAGEWAPEERLPPVGELAAAYDVSRTTMSKALHLLEGEGLVTIVQSWGVFRA
jgi:DNA-binding GntR family transcriptional regulator